ncbi:MAG: HNH endonuclease [Actinobacteria bacterium]|nr:HNH endonuclease [Actinomycetota bacterium]
MKRQGGLCALCGKNISALADDGSWRYVAGAGTHHIVAVVEGGSNDLNNLVGLCATCHNRADANRRQRNEHL